MFYTQCPTLSKKEDYDIISSALYEAIEKLAEHRELHCDVARAGCKKTNVECKKCFAGFLINRARFREGKECPVKVDYSLGNTSC